MTTTTTPAKPSPKVLCPECRRENEPERVYCHDCGTRLDRSVVHVKKEPVEDTQKRVKRMFDPQRARVRALVVGITKMLLGAGLLAMVVDMLIPPDVPPSSKELLLISSLRDELESMTKKGQPAQRQFSEDDANKLMASALKTKQGALDKPLLPYKRTVVAFKEGQCTITTERSLSGYWSVYTSCILAPEVKDGKLLGKIAGGRIGRLPIHPKLAQHMGVLFADVSAALDRDYKLISKLGALEFHDKSITLKAPASAP